MRPSYANIGIQNDHHQLRKRLRRIAAQFDTATCSHGDLERYRTAYAARQADDPLDALHTLRSVEMERGATDGPAHWVLNQLF